MHGTPIIAGSKHGRLTLVSEAPSRKYKDQTKRMVVVRCECGKTVTKQLVRVLSGYTKSCGCLQSEHRQVYGVNRRLSSGAAAFNCLYRMYEHSARVRDLAFAIDKDTFRKLTSSNCHYCGIKPSSILEREGVFGRYEYNGIDRIVNSVGYLPENCVPCCGQCNQAKHTVDYENFRAWIARVHRHLFT